MERHSGRTSLACEECRRRKRKCNGEKPQCSLCATQDRKCTYVDERYNRKRRRDQEQEYVAQLEQRVQALTEKLKKLDTNGVYYAEATDTPDLTSLRTEPADSTVSDEETRLASAIDEVGALTWKLKISDKGDTSFIGPSTNFQFTSSFQESISSSPTPSVIEYSADAFAKIESYVQDTELQQELIYIFANDLNGYHQFVDPADAASLEPLFDWSQQSPVLLLRSAIYAAAACFSSRPEAAVVGRAFHAYAESIVQQACRDHPSLIVLEAITLMCWRDLTLDNENMAWIYNCMAAGLAVHLGLHVLDLKNIDGAVPIDQQARVRAFWQVFRIDRVATFMLGRQCVIPWRRVRTPHLTSSLVGIPSIAQVAFEYECRLFFLFDKYMDQIYSFEFYELDVKTRTQLLFDARERLLAFRREIDPQLMSNNYTESTNAIVFHMSYHMCLLFVQRPLLREDPHSTLYRLAVRSMSASAASITNLIRSFKKISPLSNAPFFVVHHILTAAIMHLLGATSSDDSLRRRSINRLRICIEALDEISSARSRARKAISLLQELANRWSVVFALPLRFSYPLKQPPVIPPSLESQIFAGSTQMFSTVPMNLTHLMPMTTMSTEPDFSMMDAQIPSWSSSWTDSTEQSQMSSDVWAQGDPFELTGLEWLYSSEDHIQTR